MKTVRHYHRLGLLDEPRRDGSGYRRYGSSGLLRLVQVRTLAEAGVPLARIGAMLDAGPERFAAGLADVERRLTDRIEDLIARRGMLHRLATGNRLLLPPTGFIPETDAAIRYGLVDDYRAEVAPAWVRLGALSAC